MSKQQKSPWGSYIVKLVIGVALMVGGMWLSNDYHHQVDHHDHVLDWGWLISINDMGIPLDLGKTVATIGVFLIVFPLIRIFYLDALKEAMDSRNNELQNTFTEVEQLRSEMTQMKADYEARINETEARAREEIQGQVREAQELRKRLMSEATEKADEAMRKAQEDIASERDKVLAELRVEVAGLAIQATERILGENIDEQKNRKLVQEFLDKVEVPQA